MSAQNRKERTSSYKALVGRYSSMAAFFSFDDEEKDAEILSVATTSEWKISGTEYDLGGASDRARKRSVPLAIRSPLWVSWVNSFAVCEENVRYFFFRIYLFVWKNEKNCLTRICVTRCSNDGHFEFQIAEHDPAWERAQQWEENEKREMTDEKYKRKMANSVRRQILVGNFLWIRTFSAAFPFGGEQSMSRTFPKNFELKNEKFSETNNASIILPIQWKKWLPAEIWKTTLDSPDPTKKVPFKLECLFKEKCFRTVDWRKRDVLLRWFSIAFDTSKSPHLTPQVDIMWKSYLIQISSAYFAARSAAVSPWMFRMDESDPARSKSPMIRLFPVITALCNSVDPSLDNTHFQPLRPISFSLSLSLSPLTYWQRWRMRPFQEAKLPFFHFRQPLPRWQHSPHARHDHLHPPLDPPKHCTRPQWHHTISSSQSCVRERESGGVCRMSDRRGRRRVVTRSATSSPLLWRGWKC